VVAAALAAWPALAAPAFASALFWPAGLALAVLGASLLAGRPQGPAWALALLGAIYLLSLLLRGAALDEWAPLYAAGLLLTAELAYLSFELARPARFEAAFLARRLAWSGLLVLVALALAAAVMLVAAVPVPGSLGLTALGVAAALAAVALVGARARLFT